MWTGIARIGVGMLQGLTLAALWPTFNALSRYGQNFDWDARHIAVPLILALFFAPVAFNAGLGRLRPVMLVVWTVAAAAICAGVGLNIAYAEMRDFTAEMARATLELSTLLLIGQSLLAARQESRAQEGGYYRACFDAAWRHGLVLVLSGLLTGVFWLVLMLGKELFESAGSRLLSVLIREPYFWIPATTTVFACALHITDVRDGLTRGARTLALVLLSWLLPLLVVLVAGFLVLLAINGVDTLWRTRWAATAMLLGAALFIALINTVYRDGQTDNRAALVLRCAAAVGAVLLVPLVALAGYALFLRVRQYGWTEQRVLTSVITGIAACYAVGYLLSVLTSGLRMKLLERANIVVSLAVTGVLLVLNTPFADPVRLSVNSQVARLHAGGVEPDRFSFGYLTSDSGRYGREALQQLIATSGNADIVRLARNAATAAAAATTHRNHTHVPAVLLPEEQRAGNITVVVPEGGTLPDGFVRMNPDAQPVWFIKDALRTCFSEGGRCHAIILDRDQYGVSGVLLIPTRNAVLFTRDDTGEWRGVARTPTVYCANVYDALIAGNVRPGVLQYPNLMAAGRQLEFEVFTGCR